MAFPSVKSYVAVNPITGLTIPPIGHVFRSPRVNQGPTRKSWIYNFYLSGTSTPQNVYQDAALSVPFAPTGQVTADTFGRFPAIYLDNSIAYKVTLSNALAAVQQSRDPYNPAMATTGFAQVVAAIGPVINAQGEITLTEAGSGGTGNELTVTAGQAGALKIQGLTAGIATLVADVTVTTGAQTATFQASNRPGSELQYSVTATAAPSGGAYTGGTLTANFTGATSSLYTIVLSTGQPILGCTFTNGSTAFTTPSTAITGTPTAALVVTFNVGVAGWLPVQADGVIYYTPLFRGNSFFPSYTFKGGTYQGQMLSAATVTFTGNGQVTLTGTGASAVPPLYFSPPQAGVGANTWIQPTVTGGTGTFTGAPVGVWTNVGTGLTVGASTGATLIGTYQLSTSNTGVPVVANGTITLSSFNPVLHVYTSGANATETVPIGASNVIVECWGGGGGGSHGKGTGCSQDVGMTGGSSGYSRTSLSVALQNGKTFTYTVGGGGAGGAPGSSASAGGNSSVNAGTVTGFSAISDGGGGAGTTTVAGAGGSASGGTQANTAGTAGATTGTSGTVSGDGSPYGGGGQTGFGAGGGGQAGGTGAVVFYYT